MLKLNHKCKKLIKFGESYGRFGLLPAEKYFSLQAATFVFESRGMKLRNCGLLKLRFQDSVRSSFPEFLRK